MDIDEILSNTGFWILILIGEGTLILMFKIWNKMGSGDIMPFWAKILALLLTPVICAVMTMIFSDN